MSSARILRVGIVLAGHLVEERLVRDRGTVTIGKAAKNTFSLLHPALPRSWPILTAERGAYALHFTETMDGRLADGDGVATLAELRASGRAAARGDRWVLPITSRARGKLVLGDLMILFQFVDAPPLPPRAQLPRSVRGRLLDRIDPIMAAILFFSLVVHGGGIGWVYAQDTPRELLPDENSAHYVVHTIQPRPLPKPQPGSSGPAAEPGPAKTPEPAKPPEPGPAGDPEPGLSEADSKGVLAVIGAAGKDNPRFDDVTGGMNPGGALEDGLAKAQADKIGLVAGPVPGGGTRNDHTGSIGVGSGPDVAGPKDGHTTGPRVGEDDLKIKTTWEKPVVDDAGGLDAEKVFAKIKQAYAGALQKCYVDALKSNTSLKGRVDVVFTVGPAGNVTSVDVDGFDSAVDACIAGHARRWRFDKPDGSATFQFPFTFRHGSS